MKSVLLICAIFLISYASTSPAKGSTKASLKSKPCLKPCSEPYKPICGADNEAKPITFGSECVMNNFNCENDKHFEKQKDGECGGNAAVRLS